MIKKEEFLKNLKYALDSEEKSIPVYMEHLDSAIFWAGWDEGLVKQAKSAFKYLISESERHKTIVADLIASVKRDKKDAF